MAILVTLTTTLTASIILSLEGKASSISCFKQHKPRQMGERNVPHLIEQNVCQIQFFELNCKS